MVEPQGESMLSRQIGRCSRHRSMAGVWTHLREQNVLGERETEGERKREGGRDRQKEGGKP